VGDSGQAYSLALQADGKIVVAGQMPSAAGNMDAFVARYNSDGSADTGFGSARVVLTNFASGFDTAHAVTLQADGRIITAGAAYDPATAVQSYMLSRYFADSTSIGNTPVGTNVTVLPGNGTTVIFSSVSVAGNTTVATAGSGPVPPTGFNLGTPATFYDFQTTAVYAGLITVCIAYDPAAYGPPATLRLFHDETRWVDITTSNDTTNFVICGKATGLSRF